MVFKLIKKHFGIQKIEELATFNEEVDMHNLCQVNKLGFIMGVGHALSLFSQENGYISPWCGSKKEKGDFNSSLFHSRFDTPSSLYSHKNYVYVCEKNGSSLKRIDIGARNVSSVIKGTIQKKLTSAFKKAAKYDGETAIVVTGNGTICWTSEVVNKCFSYKGGLLKTVIGTGRRGYSNAATTVNSMISCPKGLTYSGDLYLADSGNNCIRRIHNGSQIVFGNPQESNLDLSEIASNKTSLYAINDNEVVHILLGSNRASTVYKTDRQIISICTDKNSNLYVLEKED